MKEYATEIVIELCESSIKGPQTCLHLTIKTPGTERRALFNRITNVFHTIRTGLMTRVAFEMHTSIVRYSCNLLSEAVSQI
jgi:hypothetical protein